MRFLIFLIIITITSGCDLNSHQQEMDSRSTNLNGKMVGGGCDGCELIYEGMPDAIGWIDTFPDWHETKQQMEISGTVYNIDGKTPATNVILYFYHTDSGGYYSVGEEQRKGKRHGHIRGWVKTNNKGEYKIYTGRPAPYPGADIPAHIHAIVKEPVINEYYIDEFEFAGDPLLTSSLELKREKRGGSGIVQLNSAANGMRSCNRDIILGLNIPDYY